MNAREIETDGLGPYSGGPQTVHHCTYVNRRGVDIKVRVRLVFREGDVIEIRANRVLDNTLLGEDVPLTDDEEDLIVGEVLRG